jgi:hypothetical protein
VFTPIFLPASLRFQRRAESFYRSGSTEGTTCRWNETLSVMGSECKRNYTKIYHSFILTAKAIPVTGCGGPLGCETSRLPHFLDNRFAVGGEVSLTRRPPFTPQEDSWYSFPFEAETTAGP